MKQRPIEMTTEQIGQHLDMWFTHAECEALAREAGFIQRNTSRLTGSDFFNLLTVETLNEPAISYEGLCDLLEDHHPNLEITPHAGRGFALVPKLQQSWKLQLPAQSREAATCMDAGCSCS